MMKNRDRLIRDFEEMSSEKLAEAIRDFRNNTIAARIVQLVCDDCYAEHHRHCISSDGRSCQSLEEWLDKDCQHPHIIC